MSQTNSIPASEIVAVNPNVLSAGGSALEIIGLVLTTSTRVPIGTVAPFADPADVATFFGSVSDEAAAASIYFDGFDGANVMPDKVLYAQYPATAVAAYLRGGNISAVALSALQALSGSLTVVMDGYAHVISSINLSSYNSQSAMAAAIQAAFTDPTEASFTASLGASFTATAGSPSTQLVVTSVTGLISIGDTVTGTGVPASTTIVSQLSGTTGGAGTYILSGANTTSAAACTCASTVLNVTVCASPTIAVGQTLAGSGITGTPLITAQISGTVGGIGVYRISGAQFNVASEAMTGVATVPLVTYDSVSGAFVVTSGVTGAASLAAFATGTLAAPLLLTSATGAVLSQGAAATDPITFMNNLILATQNWVSFMTVFNPDASGNATKMLFAQWTNSQNQEYAYICWDTDVTPTATVPATGCMGYLLAQAQYSGTFLIWAPSYDKAAFGCGIGASIDFTETNGRTTYKFRTQGGLMPDVTNATVANNLAANGYNYYGGYATRSQSFNFLANGVVSGKFDWMDTYINQIQLNNALQQAILLGLTQAKSIPYNSKGYSLIEAWCMDPINAALNFGSIQPGVTLSAAQVQEVNQDAGSNIANVLSTRGWYLQVQDASPQVRANRQSPPCTLWYMDGGSVQQIDLDSITVQ